MLSERSSVSLGMGGTGRSSRGPDHSHQAVKETVTSVVGRVLTSETDAEVDVRSVSAVPSPARVGAGNFVSVPEESVAIRPSSARVVPGSDVTGTVSAVPSSASVETSERDSVVVGEPCSPSGLESEDLTLADWLRIAGGSCPVPETVGLPPCKYYVSLLFYSFQISFAASGNLVFGQFGTSNFLLLMPCTLIS